MKKIITGIIAVIFIFSLSACSSSVKKPSMYIEKAELSQQEENIAKLLGDNNDQLIYDFKLDDTVKSVQINTYKLIDGKWKMISGGGQQFPDGMGRLALDFENLAEGLRIALQSEHSSGSTKYSAEPAEEITGIGRATSMLNDLTEITYEKEIPLVVQISTAQNSINSYNVDYFFTPDEYQKHSYEHVYAITILFSQKTVGELDTAN
ncbi:hypothetical protein OXPF_11650 [Oxobacter pfennigii]|uniref:Lipoprotein n=1 Tax=Oxobacter pfennigii TaxID=36849 RepID=A0A0P8YDE8_9CLOT|nr:hypothetical protein [Oxobacter pfennigii]KPU45273.1 hypothetical protein OXPF_11650 [Oxobacter pfennigii]